MLHGGEYYTFSFVLRLSPAYASLFSSRGPGNEATHERSSRSVHNEIPKNGRRPAGALHVSDVRDMVLYIDRSP